MGRGVGRRDARGLARLDGRIPHPAVTAAVRPATQPYLRLHGGSRPVPLLPAGELAPVPAVAGGGCVAGPRDPPPWGTPRGPASWKRNPSRPRGTGLQSAP